MFYNVDNVGVERMSSGRLFQTEPATQNAAWPCSLVLGIRPNHHEPQNGEQKSDADADATQFYIFTHSRRVDEVCRTSPTTLSH